MAESVSPLRTVYRTAGRGPVPPPGGRNGDAGGRGTFEPGGVPGVGTGEVLTGASVIGGTSSGGGPMLRMAMFTASNSCRVTGVLANSLETADIATFPGIPRSPMIRIAAMRHSELV